MRTVLSVCTFILSTICPINSQSLQENISNKQLATNYLDSKNEVCFSFKAKNENQVKALSQFLSFSHKSIDKNELEIEAYANKETFTEFLKYGLPYQVKKSENELNFNPHLSGQSSQALNRNSNVMAGWDTTWDAYPTYSQYTSKMQYYIDTYPELCSLQSIGKTKNGRDLWVLKISDNVLTKETEPEFLYTSSMHGDEIAGYPLMIRLIDYLLSNYGTNAEVTDIINSTEIYINPSANPDGTYGAIGSNTITSPTRSNRNGQDLNRNYPDNVNSNRLHYSSINDEYENETKAFMAFEERMNFVLSANFHGGIELVNYPNDNTTLQHPDHDYYEYISNEYAIECQNSSDLLGDTTYMTVDEDASVYPSPGVTNGATWYIVYGGRQDYMNYYRHSKEITVELSDVKYLAGSQLPNHWEFNKQALLNYIKQANYGFQGIISDESGNPVPAKVNISSHDENNSWVTSNKELGDYYRLIKAGTYTVTFEAPGYETQTEDITVTDNSKTIKNIIMVPLTRDPNVSDVSICEGSTTQLTASGTGVINWYNTANDTTPIYTGTNFTTPIISSNTSYFVENIIENPNVGELQLDSNGSFLGGERYLIFDSSKMINLNEVTINANQPGEMEVQLQDNTGKMIDSRIIIINSAGIQNIKLDFIVPIASNLRLVAKELSNGLSLYRNNSNTNYPYTNGPITIKSSSASNGTDFYYFFYDWKINDFKSNKKEVKINVENRPQANFEFNINPLNNGEVYFINTSNNTNEYNWDFGDGLGTSTEADPTYVFFQTGNYNVKLTSGNSSCGNNVITIPVFVTVATLGNETPILEEINIYPNPFNDVIIINFPNKINTISYKLFDLSGRLILNASNQKTIEHRIIIPNISTLSNGTYLLKIEDKNTNNSVVKKVVRTK